MQNCLDTVLTSLNIYKKRGEKHLQQAGIYGTWLKRALQKASMTNLHLTKIYID